MKPSGLEGSSWFKRFRRLSRVFLEWAGTSAGSSNLKVLWEEAVQQPTWKRVQEAEYLRLGPFRTTTMEKEGGR
jgi:hypothetical protein